MEDSFTTLFQQSVKAYAKSSAAESWKAKVLGIVLFPIVVPALLIGAAISIPLAQIMRVKQDWAELKSAMGAGKGTVIGEYRSMKGPFRLWWTPEDIPKTSPYACGKEVSKEWAEMESQKFFRWCYSRFTKPEDGLARLVVVPEEERKRLTKTLSGALRKADYASGCQRTMASR